MVSVGGQHAGGLLTVPYYETTHRYEIELWGYPNGGFRAALDDRGR